MFVKQVMEWARFFVISELEGKQKFIGYGYGNSYEKLVFEIEKPHSLILSLYYQIGLIGVLYYLIIFIYGLYSIIVSLQNKKTLKRTQEVAWFESRRPRNFGQIAQQSSILPLATINIVLFNKKSAFIR